MAFFSEVLAHSILAWSVISTPIHVPIMHSWALIICSILIICDSLVAVLGFLRCISCSFIACSSQKSAQFSLAKASDVEFTDTWSDVVQFIIFMLTFSPVMHSW